MIDFDTTSGRLRLDQPAFGALLDHVAPDGAPADPGIVGELRGAGVLDGDDPDPRLLPALQAVLAPACQVRLTVADRAQAVFHQMWVGGPTSALLLQTRGPVHELMTLPSALLPAFVASTARVGPRKIRAEDRFDLGGSARDDLLSLDDDVRRSAFESLRGAAPQGLADAVESDTAWTWGVESAWKNAHDELAGSWLHVVDSPAGTWVRDDDGFGPSSGTELWRALVTLLPDDHELAADVLAGLATQAP